MEETKQAETSPKLCGYDLAEYFTKVDCLGYRYEDGSTRLTAVRFIDPDGHEHVCGVTPGVHWNDVLRTYEGLGKPRLFSNLASWLIGAAARAAHEANRAYCASLGDNSQKPWNDAPEWQRKSAVMGVHALLQNPEMTPAQQHSCWMARKLAEGWVYVEKKDADAKTHPCLVPYDQLPAEQKLKDHLFGAVVRAVIGASL